MTRKLSRKLSRKNLRSLKKRVTKKRVIQDGGSFFFKLKGNDDLKCLTRAKKYDRKEIKEKIETLKTIFQEYTNSCSRQETKIIKEKLTTELSLKNIEEYKLDDFCKEGSKPEKMKDLGDRLVYNIHALAEIIANSSLELKVKNRLLLTLARKIISITDHEYTRDKAALVSAFKVKYGQPLDTSKVEDITQEVAKLESQIQENVDESSQEFDYESKQLDDSLEDMFEALNLDNCDGSDNSERPELIVDSNSNSPTSGGYRKKKQSRKRRRNRNKNKKQTKKAGMLKRLSKMVRGQSLEDKLYKDIESLMNENIPKKPTDKNNLAAFILKKNNKSNSSHKYFKFKANVYSIAERISYLDVTNTHKLTLLKYLEKTLKRFVGNDNLPRVIEKLRNPSLVSSRNNLDLAEEFARMNIVNSKAKMNATFRDVNSRLNSTNQFKTRPVDNGWESVNRINPTEVNNLMESAQIEADFSELDKIQKTLKTPRRGGYTNIRKTRKRVYT